MKNILYCLIALLGMSSCVEDDGCGSRGDVNIVTLDIPVTKTVKFNEGTYTFDASEFITQTHAADLSNLKFEWGRSGISFVDANNNLEKGEVVSTESSIDIAMGSIDEFSDFANYYRLRILDELTNITYYADLKIMVLRPFEGSWAVLHRQGGTKVGAVEFLGEGETKTYTDLFGEYGVAPLTGSPVSLGILPRMDRIDLPPVYKRYENGGQDTYNDIFFVITDNPDESANYAQWAGFAKTRRISDMVSNPSLIGSAELAAGAYIAGTTSVSGKLGAVIGGRMYKAQYALRMYQSRSDLTGDYFISCGLKVSIMTLGYDRIGRRLVYCSDNNEYGRTASPIYSPTAWDEAKENADRITSMQRSSNPSNIVVDPLPADREVIYFGCGPYSGNTTNARYVTSFALAVGVNGNPNSYVYKITDGDKLMSTSNPAVTDLYTFETPEGMTADGSCFAATTEFNGFFYYSSGNAVYRFNYITGNRTLVYEHPAGGTIAAMKFARDQAYEKTPDYVSYEYPVRRSLGIAINNGANGELVILELSESGTILKASDKARSPLSVYSGFGEIKDVVFM